MWNKIQSVFLFQMKLVRTNQRILMILILVAIFIFSNLQGVSEFSQDVGISATPWAFPHITSDYICQLVIMAGAVALFCDAPFNSDIQKYILSRAGHSPWAAGQCMYIIALSFLYVLMILVISILSLLPNLELQDGWGKVWGTLARNMVIRQYGIQFSVYDYLIGAYTPIQATTLSFLLSFECCVWLGLLTYFLNYVTEGYTGTFISAGFVLMDITVANEWLPWFYKISPVTLAQLQALKGNNSLYQVDLDYALWFFGVSIVCLLVSCIIAPKFHSLRRKRK